MKDLEFRAWLKKQNKMIKVINLNFTMKNVCDCFFNYYKFDEIELMEYTGCEDKNGVEIFEGDIVKHSTFYKGKILESINYVEFEKGCFNIKNSSLTKHLFLSEEYENEVIGNLYENPELLEEL